jgi:hypothetical protein
MLTNLAWVAGRHRVPQALLWVDPARCCLRTQSWAVSRGSAVHPTSQPLAFKALHPSLDFAVF